MTNQEASDAGKALGQQQDALITPQINSTTLGTHIPNAKANPTETQFFGGGKADNYLPGDNKRIACDTGTPDPDPYKQQQCNAINLIAKAPSQRPQVEVSRNDPILQREQAVRANASNIVGGAGISNNPNGLGIAGTYSDCTTTTTPDPAPPEIKTCTDFLQATETTEINSCQKSVATTQTCHQIMSFTVTQPAPIPATPVYSCSSGTLSGTNCTYPATAASTTYTCSSGTLSGTKCYYPAYQPPGITATATPGSFAGVGFVGGWIACSGSLPANSCPAGSSWQLSGGCLVKCSADGTLNPSGKFARCVTPATYSCPSGYTLSGTTCYPPTVTPPPTNATVTYNCPTGYTLSGTTCTKPDTAATVTYTCGSGMTLSGSTCTPAAVVTETFTDNCATLEAKTK